MKPLFLALVSSAILVLAGCAGEVKEPPESKVKVDVPGVKVDIKKSSEADPQPDVNVDIKKQ